MKTQSIFRLLVCFAITLVGAAPAFAFSLVDMQPNYGRFEVFADEPLKIVADTAINGTTIAGVTIFDMRTENYLAGAVSLATTNFENDTIVFTPTGGAFPFAHRLLVEVPDSVLDVDGAPLADALPYQGIFVVNLPNDLERPAVPGGNGFPVELYVNSNVLLGFNPIDPESTDPDDPRYIPGMSATEAWKLWTGDPSVLIAVIDDGTDELANPELSERLYLNRGELPQPENDGEPCADWDCNGDSRFSPSDYANDGSAYDANENGRLDPEDLFIIYSDEVDNDGNGYVDDISGWDFFRNVNTPLGVKGFPEGTHGHMRAEDAVAEANNGVANKPGFCPDCTVMVVRVGEAIMTEFNLMTAGMEYALDMGADIIVVAMGVADYNYESEAAFVDAFERGAFVVAASGDELGFHHIYPAAGEDVYSVKAVMPLPPVQWGPIDLSVLAFVESYCTNYGAHTEATGVTGACSSEATSNIAGIAGLLLSYAHSQGMDLTPGELRQLINMTADDIKKNCFAFNMEGCKEGWEQNFGYGRVNANKAILALGDPTFDVPERIPPDLRMISPRWWTTIDPTKQPNFDVEGSIYARGRPYQWTLELAFGVQPDDNEFQTVQSGNGTQPFEGVLATIDPMNFVNENWLRRQPEKSNDFTVTLRLRAWWTPEGGDPVVGEIRKAIAWHTDDDTETGLMADLPEFIGASGASSPQMIDLDGDPDGALEIVFATAIPSVEAFKYDNEAHTFVTAPGFPVYLPQTKAYADAVMASPAIGQVFGDGVPYIAVATNHGLVYLIHPDGNDHAGGPFVDGFPVSALEPDNSTPLSFAHGNAFLASPVLADLDGDGLLEIVAAAYDQHLYAWKPLDDNHDGEADLMSGWPVPLFSDEAHDLVPPGKVCETTMPAQVLGTPVAAILDPDHENADIADHPAIIVGTTEVCEEGLLPTGRVYAVYWNGLDNEDGPFLPGWPAKVLTPLGGELPIPPLTIGMTSSPAAVRQDGELIVGVGSFFWLPQLIHWDGSDTSIQHLPSRLNLGVTANGSFGRFDETGDIWYFFPSAGFLQATDAGFYLASFNIVGWRLNDTSELAWRKHFDDINFFVNPVLADLDNDGRSELLAGSGGYIIHANNVDLEEPEDWPKFTQNWLTSAVVVDDANNDGLLEVGAITQEGNLFAWRTVGNACVAGESNSDWPRFHHDPYNSGMYGLDATPPRLTMNLHAFLTDDADRFTLALPTPGDDQSCGTAAAIEVRYSTDAGTDLRDGDAWSAATLAGVFEPTPGSKLTRLDVDAPGAAVFAIRSYDEGGLASFVSNLAVPEQAPGDDDDDDDDSADDDDDNDTADDDDDDDDEQGDDDDDDSGCGC